MKVCSVCGQPAARRIRATVGPLRFVLGEALTCARHEHAVRVGLLRILTLRVAS